VTADRLADKGQQKDGQKEEGQRVLAAESLHGPSVVGEADDREVGDPADQDHGPDQSHCSHGYLVRGVAGKAFKLQFADLIVSVPGSDGLGERGIQWSSAGFSRRC